MRRAFLPLMAVITLSACQKPEPKELGVHDAWVRLAAVPGRPAAAYFTLTGGAASDRLIAVESPKVATIELHAGGMEGGMMTMKPLPGADVPGGAKIAFAPGGSHAMLFGVDPSVTAGANLPLSFRFQSGKTLETKASVVAAGDAAPRADRP